PNDLSLKYACSSATPVPPPLSAFLFYKSFPPLWHRHCHAIRRYLWALDGCEMSNECLLRTHCHSLSLHDQNQPLPGPFPHQTSRPGLFSKAKSCCRMP